MAKILSQEKPFTYAEWTSDQLEVESIIVEQQILKDSRPGVGKLHRQLAHIAFEESWRRTQSRMFEVELALATSALGFPEGQGSAL